MTIFDKTLYLQRLLYAINQAGKLPFPDRIISDNVKRTMTEAETKIDDAINLMHNNLSWLGLMPEIKER